MRVPRATAAPARLTAVAASTAAKIPQLSWDRVRPAGVVLVSGPEELLAERAIRMLRDTLRTEDPSLETSDIEADHYAPGELITLASPSLFGEPRLVRVSMVEKCTDAFIEECLSYLAQPAEGAYLVLRHGGGVRGKKLLDAIRGGLGNGIEVQCLELKKDAEKYDFAVAEFATAGRRITPGAMRALTNAFSGDIAELAAACQQLMSDSTDEITEATVEKYYGGRVETNAFAVADIAIAGRHGEALVLLRHALSSGADPVPLLAAFALKVRTMAKVSGSNDSSGQLAQRLGLAPWQVDRARRDVRGWTDAGLATVIESLADTDAQIKGGGRDPVFALERLVGIIANRGE
jgi:DNA polymerase III subunit delta